MKRANFFLHLKCDSRDESEQKNKIRRGFQNKSYGILIVFVVSFRIKVRQMIFKDKNGEAKKYKVEAIR